MRTINSIVGKYITLVLFSTFFGLTSTNISAAPDISVPEGKAAIYFFRTGFGGGAVKFHVHDMEGKPVGYLGKNGDNFTIIVEPGKHQYWSRAARRNDVVLNVEAGKVYYVKGTVNMGFAVGRPVLQEVSADQVP